MIYIYPDTNSFIHYQFITELDIGSLVGSNNYRVIVMPQILSEIDKHKYSERSKLRKRAQEIIKRLEPLLLNEELVEGLEFAKVNIDVESLKANGYDLNDSDDIFLFSVIKHSLLNSINSNDVFIITSDLGLKIKCRSRDIPFITLPEDHEYPLEKDKLEIENVKLRRELHALKRKQPKISILFHDGSREITGLNSYSEIPMIESWISYQVQKLEEKHPKYSLRGFPLNKRNIELDEIAKSKFDITPNVLRTSESNIREYNEKLEKYFAKCEALLVDAYENEKYRSHSIVLDIKIENSGSEPAINTDLVIESSQDVYLMHEKLLPKISKLPSPPEKPSYGFILGNFSTEYHIPEDALKNFNSPHIVDPSIELIDRKKLKINLGKVKHNLSKDIGTIYLRRGYDDFPEKVILNCYVTCDNLSSKISNTLIIRSK